MMIYNKNIPFCFGYFKFINPNNKYRQESFIIFTTIYQFKILRDANIIYMDGTFRTAPKGFYQMFNIIANDSNSHINIPVAHIPMTHKTQFLYEHVFNTLLNIASDNGLELSFDSKTIMTDFEKPIRNAIKNILKGVKLKGCFFHFVKALWSKSKKLGLCRKNKIKNTKIIIFSLKMSTLLKREEQIKLFDDIDTFISNFEDNKSYILFMNYFNKNWKNNKFIIFDLIKDNQVRSRTNNIAEGFHRKLNQLIEIQNPKCSLVVDVIKNITINNFKKSIKNLTVVKYEKDSYPDIWSSCYDYIIRFHQKYHCNFNINKIMELKDNPEFNIDKICNLMLSLYNDKFIEDNLNKGKDINFEDDNDLEDIEIEDLINKTDKMNLNDSMDVDENNDYSDEAVSFDLKNKQIKKRLYIDISTEIMEKAYKIKNI